MVYLVSKEPRLISPENYQVISAEKALELLEPLTIIGADTETEGLDPYRNKLLSVQLGNEDFQVVIDCLTIDIQLFKEYLESDRLFIFWNAAFDLKFLYHQRIIVNNVYDGFLAEKLLYLGYPMGEHGMSLKAAGENYVGVELDKTVRGQIITKGLTENVVIYAANDVKYEIPIREKQLEKIREKDLEKALQFENEFVKVLAYIEYCGVHLDVQKWKTKMAHDNQQVQTSKTNLDNYVIGYCKLHPDLGTTYQYIDTEGMNEYSIKIEEMNLPKGAIRDPSKDYGYVRAYKLQNSNPFIYKDLQGDLFSGFDHSEKCKINWNSAQQVIPFLEVLGVNVTSFDPKTKTSKKSVEEKVLEPQSSKFPFIPLYLSYKKAQKVVSTYGENFLKAINPISGRIHASFNQLGTDTGRMSSGGGVYKINMQNLPHDEETRACFTAEPGNKWISCDYKSQESQLIASIANDPAMIEIFQHGCGDIHSLVAKMAYPEIIGNTPVEEIHSKFKSLRQEAKGVEFAINYGGDATTICKNKGIPMEEAQKIYDNYMKGFPGVAVYQKFRRKDVFDKGYILLNPVTKHKSFIPEETYSFLRSFAERMSLPGFWQDYRMAKATHNDPQLLEDYKAFNKKKSEIEKHSINYVIQGTGALCFKLSSIKFFNYLKANNLLFKVLYAVPVHDELNVEAPSEIANEIADVIVKCMEDGAAPFCTRLKLSADKSIEDFWVH